MIPWQRPGINTTATLWCTRRAWEVYDVLFSHLYSGSKLLLYSLSAFESSEDNLHSLALTI